MAKFIATVISICLVGAMGGQITNVSDYVVVLQDKGESSFRETLMLGQVKTIQIYNQSGVVLSTDVEITSRDKGGSSICEVVPHDIKIINVPNNVKQIFEETSNIQLQLGQRKTQITNMVHVERGMVITTTNNKVYGYLFQRGDEKQFYEPKQVLQSSYGDLMQQSINSTEAGETFTPMLVYNPKSSTIYLIGDNEIVFFQVRVDAKLFVSQKKRAVLNITNIVAAKSSQLYLMLATKKVIHILQIDEKDGSLTPWRTIVEEQIYNKKQNLNIQDLVIGGRYGQYLYVLDKNNGVFTILIERNRAALNQQLGLIKIKGGYRMDQYLDESLLVLVENPGAVKSHQVIDFSIDIFKGEWFILNQFTFPGRALGIDVSKTIAVVRGMDSHRIIFHSRYKEFVKNPNEDIIFYAPSLIALDFFEPNYGRADEASWHFNQSHNVIFGVNQNQLRYYPWEEVQPYIRCFTNNSNNQNEEFDFVFHSNMTQCDAKQKLGDVISRDLFVCEKVQKLQLKIEGVLIGNGDSKLLFYGFVLGLVLVVAALIISFIWKYKNYKKVQATRSIEISNLMKKGREYIRETETPSVDKAISIENE